MTVLVTGAAGFIGFHTIQRLCREGQEVVGIDNLNDYYDVEFKHARLKVPEGSVAGGNRLFNIGRGMPVALLDFVECLESALDLQARRNYLPMQAGDVVKTWADVSALADWVGFSPQVTLETGVGEFVKWYRQFFQI